jgi:hypothetical protein
MNCTDRSACRSNGWNDLPQPLAARAAQVQRTWGTHCVLARTEAGSTGSLNRWAEGPGGGDWVWGTI